jgi:hypothetical protein
VTRSPRITFACTAVAALFLLAWTGVSQAQTRTAWMSAKAMSAKIHGLVPQIPTTNTSAPSIISAATCRGVGKARGTKYSSFRCTASWDHGKAQVFARALPGGRFCASSTGPAACPAGTPAGGDPRICHRVGAPPTADPNSCALTTTETALTRAMVVAFRNPNWQPGNVGCKGSNLTRTCTFQQLGVYGVYYESKIRFALEDGAWSATIQTTGGSVPATCTVLPAHTAAGKPSKWTTGPTPTCA